MKRHLTFAFSLALAGLGGYGYGRWYSTDHTVSAKTGPRVLYYRCPMHPSVHADQPGLAPCCHMKLEPVYEDTVTGIESGPLAGVISTTPEQRQLIGVQYGTVSFGPMSRTLRAAASVSPDENRIARVQTKLEGWVDQVVVKAPGVKVKRGQTLLTVYNPKSQLAQQEYLQAMDAAEVDMLSTEYIQAHANNRLVAKESQTLAARMQLAQLGFTEAQIETIGKAHRTMTRLPVTSPIAGVVLEYNVQPRQKLSAEALYVIADLSKVWVTADFPAGDETAIQPGQIARLTIPYLPGRAFHGSVETVLPAINPDTRSLRVRLEFENPDFLLLPKMAGEVELRIGAGRNRLSVPREAVLDNGGRQSVFVDLGAGRFAPRTVQIAERFGDRVAIANGLKAGERIVTSGNFLLDSEARLRSR